MKELKASHVGTFLVTTESGSRYEVRLCGHSNDDTFTRVTEANELRMDGERLPLLSDPNFKVGERGILWTQIPGVDGPTYRITTPVVSIERVDNAQP